MASQTTQPIAVFTAGGAASGKTTALKATQYAAFPVVDPDKFKPLHPEYDPKQPQLVHEWSKIQAAELRRRYLRGQVSHVVDGTGAKAASFCGRIEEARQAGFRVVVIWCRCTLETGLLRNAARKRTVKESIVRKQYASIPGVMAIAREIVDAFTEIDTN